MRTSARIATVAVLAALAAFAALLVPQIADSQVDGETAAENVGEPATGSITAVPSQGPTGTRIAVAGDGCSLPGTNVPADAVIVDLAGPDGIVFTAQLGLEEDGTWQGEVAAPAGTPPGELQVSARCVAPELDLIHYEPVPHEVTGEGAPELTGTLPPTSTVEAPDPSLAVGPPAPEDEVGVASAGLPAFHNPRAPIEPLPSYDGQTTCSPAAKPGMVGFQQIVRAAYPSQGAGSISRQCNVGGVSEHKEGRAWDWPVNAFNGTQAGYASQVVNWLLRTDSQGNRYANARRLGVMYIIWNRQMFRMYRPQDGWQPYNGSSPHTDHVHWSLTRAGGAGTTSWWTAPPDPCRGQSHQPFCDVGPSHQFRTEILWTAQNGIADGWPDTSFRPLEPVSRQAMAAFLYRLSGSPGYNPPAQPSYSDVGANHLFRREIEWLRHRGIGTGYEDGRFLPLRGVSRQAMAAFMHRAAGAPTFRGPTTPSFRDTEVGRPFYDEIHWLVSRSITTGYADGTFRPDANVSRQAMAAFLMRLAPHV